MRPSRASRGTEEDGVRVRGRFVRQRRDVQAAQDDEHAAGAIAIGDSIGAVGVRDVDLDDDQVGFVVRAHGYDILAMRGDQSARRAAERAVRYRAVARRRSQRIWPR
jgi:hypothetical protein